MADRERLFKELNLQRSRLNDAIQQHDKKGQQEIETIIKSITDQIRAIGSTRLNTQSQQALPVPPQPVNRNQTRPSIFSDPIALSSPSPPVNGVAVDLQQRSGLTTGPNPFVNRYSFPTNLFDPTVNIQTFKDQFLRIQSQTDQSLDSSIEALILALEFEQQRDPSIDALFTNAQFSEQLHKISLKFQDVQLFSPNIREAINSMERDIMTLDNMRQQKSLVFVDSLKRLRTLVVNSDRIFGGIVGTLDELLYFFDPTPTGVVLPNSGIPAVSTSRTLTKKVADHFSFLMAFVSEYGARVNYVTNDCIKLLLQLCETWVQWVRERSDLVSSCVSRSRYLLSLVRSVDFNRLIESLSNAAKGLTMLDNQLAVFFVGASGVGKTTLIHVVANSQFTAVRPTTGTTRTRLHYEAKCPSHLNEHMTKFVVHSPYEPTTDTSRDAMLLNCLPVTTAKGQKVWFVDTPPLGESLHTDAFAVSPKRDTDELISYIISTIQAMKRCSHVKIVFCTTERDILESTRAGALQDLCTLVTSLYANPIDRVSLIYALGPCDHEDRLYLSNAVQNKAIALPVSGAKSLLVDLGEKLRKPETSNCGAYLVKLNDAQCRNMLLQAFIDFDTNVVINPSQALVIDVLPLKLKEELTRQFRLVMSAVQRSVRSRDVDGVNRLLNTLFELVKLLSLPASLAAYLDAVRDLATSLTGSSTALVQFSDQCFITASSIAWSREVEETISSHFLTLISFDDPLKQQILKFPQIKANNTGLTQKSFVGDTKKLINNKISEAIDKYFCNAVPMDVLLSEEVKRILTNAQHFLVLLQGITVGNLGSVRQSLIELKEKATSTVEQKMMAGITDFKAAVKQSNFVNSIAIVRTLKELLGHLQGRIVLTGISLSGVGLGLAALDITLGNTALTGVANTPTSGKLSHICVEVCQNYLLQYVHALCNEWKIPADLYAACDQYHQLIDALHQLMDVSQTESLTALGFNRKHLNTLLTDVMEVGFRSLRELSDRAIAALRDPTNPDIFTTYFTFYVLFDGISSQKSLKHHHEVDALRSKTEDVLKKLVNKLYESCRSSLTDIWAANTNAFDISNLKTDQCQLLRATLVLHQQATKCNSAFAKSLCSLFDEILKNCEDKLTEFWNKINQPVNPSNDGSNKPSIQSLKGLESEEDLQFALDNKVIAEHILDLFSACSTVITGLSTSANEAIVVDKRIKKILTLAELISTQVDNSISGQLRFVTGFFETLFESLRTNVAIIAFVERMQATATRDGYVFDYGEEAMRILNALSPLQHKSRGEVDRLKQFVTTKLPHHYDKVHTLLGKRYHYLVPNPAINNSSDPTDLYVTMHIDQNALGDNFAELACGLKYLQAMATVHNGVASPLPVWVNNLQWFYDESFNRSSQWTNSAQLYQFSDMCMRMGKAIDSLLPSNLSFCSLARSIIGSRKDGIMAATTAIHSKDYRAVAANFKLLGLDIIQADNISGMSQERAHLVETLKSTVNNHFTSVIARVDKMTFDGTTNDHAVAILWKDLVQLATAEVFLSSQIFFDGHTDLPAKRISLIEGLQTWKGKIDATKALVQLSFDDDLIKTIALFGKIQKVARTHNCFDLPLSDSTHPETVCAHCLANQLHSKAATMIHGKNDPNNKVTGLVMREINDSLLEIMSHLTSIVTGLERTLTNAITILQKNAALLSKSTTKEEYGKRLPPMKLIGHGDSLMNSNDIMSLNIGTNSSPNGTISTHATTLLGGVETLVNNIDQQLTSMLTQVKNIDALLNPTLSASSTVTLDISALKGWCQMVTIMYEKINKLPQYVPNNLYDKFKPVIVDYFIKVWRFVDQEQQGRTIEDADVDSSETLPAIPSEYYVLINANPNPAGSDHVVNPAVVNHNAPVAKNELLDFTTQLTNSDEIVGLQAILENVPKLIKSTFLKNYKTHISNLLTKSTQRLEAFRTIEIDREQFLTAYQNSKLFINLCLKCTDLFFKIHEKYPAIYDKSMAVSAIEQLRISLTTLIGKLYEHLSVLIENSKKLQGTMNAISHASDLDQLAGNCSSFQLMYRYVPLCVEYSADIRKSVVGKEMKELPHSAEDIVKFFQTFIGEAITFITTTDFINQDTRNANASDRKGFYLTIASRLAFLRELKWLQSDSQKHQILTIKPTIETNIKKWFDFGIESVKDLNNAGGLANVNLKNFNLALSNLLLIQEMLPDYKDSAKDQSEYLLSGIFKCIRDIVQQLIARKIQNAKEEALIRAVSRGLLMLNGLASMVDALEDKIITEINNVLEYHLTTDNGPMVILALSSELLNTTDGSGSSMVVNSNFKAFDEAKRRIRITPFLNLSLEVMLDNLTGDDLDKPTIGNAATTFTTEYWKLVNDYLKRQNDIPNIPEETKNIATSRQSHTWDTLQKILVRVCGYWTLTNLSKSGNTGREYLLQPHLGQIIAILRLLGFDAPKPSGSDFPDKQGNFDWAWFGDKKVKLRNHLTQVRTGEGKSVILGVLSTTLALMNFEVDCVCYSKHLSDRDYAEFKALFEHFKVQDAITYGTFNQLCESMLNKDGNVREAVERLISTNADSDSSGKTSTRTPGFGSTGKKRILLIDEVDVFFQPGFYGSAYNIFATLKAKDHREIEELITDVWSCKSLSLAADKLLEQMKTKKSYKDCISKFSNWRFVIEEGVKEMLSTLSTYESHEYHFDHATQKIGYLDTDNTISYKKVKGYNTMFAYLKERDVQQRITNKELVKEHMNILVHSSTFSYAEFPKYYVGILGVSGTLDTLSKQEKDILQNEFRLSKFTYLPSVYPLRNMWAENDLSSIRIVEDAQFDMNIVDEMQRRRGPPGGTQRPILIFFPTKNALDVFRASEPFALFRDDALMLVAGMEENERIKNISKAMDSGRVTLLTREFGRGTDFHCLSTDIEKQGGIHVISTFISLEVSEEKQIIGRTGRQGKSGSFSMVLRQRALCETVNLTEADIQVMERTSRKYDGMDRNRKIAYEQKFPERLEFIAQLLIEHKLSEEFVYHLLVTDNRLRVKAFLSKKNTSQYGEIRSRTVILLDATGSMSDLLAQAKQTVKETIDRVCGILKVKNIDSGFQIQFGAYRNYSCHPDDLLAVSTWASSPTELIEYITKIESDGGMGNEAIEVALNHVNNELKTKKITQVIIIGDASSNTRDETLRRRQSYNLIGQDPRYASPVFFDEELQKLCDANVRINAFYIKNRGNAQQDFTIMANKSRGVCNALDVKDPKAVDNLTGIVSTNILNDIGGKELVEAYTTRFGFHAEGFV